MNPLGLLTLVAEVRAAAGIQSARSRILALLFLTTGLACDAARIGDGIKAPVPMAPMRPMAPMKPMAPISSTTQNRQDADGYRPNRKKSKESKPVSAPNVYDSPTILDAQGNSLGKLSSDKYDPESVSNPYGAGSKYKADGVNNPYGKHGSLYSNESVSNPHAANAPKLVDSQGNIIGKLSANTHDPESVSNPYGAGSKYKPDGVNNPYGKNHIEPAVMNEILQAKGNDSLGQQASKPERPSLLKRIFSKKKSDDK